MRVVAALILSDLSTSERAETRTFMAPRVELEVLEHAELPLDEIGIAITRQSAWRAAGISLKADLELSP